MYEQNGIEMWTMLNLDKHIQSHYKRKCILNCIKQMHLLFVLMNIQQMYIFILNLFPLWSSYRVLYTGVYIYVIRTLLCYM